MERSLKLSELEARSQNPLGALQEFVMAATNVPRQCACFESLLQI